MCLYPKLIKNKKYQENIKNGGDIPIAEDNRVLWVAIGCGNCMECRKKQAMNWRARLGEDIKENKNARFVTLTFNEKSLQELTTEALTMIKSKIHELQNGKIQGQDVQKQIQKLENTLTRHELPNAIARLATRKFLERWRKQYKKSLRHWLVTELGHTGTERIHLHGIIWTNEPMTQIEKIWSYGWVWKGKKENAKTINYVNEQTINYITKYIFKQDDVHKNYNSIVLTSAGIGANYVQKKTEPG